MVVIDLHISEEQSNPRKQSGKIHNQNLVIKGRLFQLNDTVFGVMPKRQQLKSCALVVQSDRANLALAVLHVALRIISIEELDAFSIETNVQSYKGQECR